MLGVDVDYSTEEVDLYEETLCKVASPAPNCNPTRKTKKRTREMKMGKGSQGVVESFGDDHSRM